jgi:hypothetical protein
MTSEDGFGETRSNDTDVGTGHVVTDRRDESGREYRVPKVAPDSDDDATWRSGRRRATRSDQRKNSIERPQVEIRCRVPDEIPAAKRRSHGLLSGKRAGTPKRAGGEIPIAAPQDGKSRPQPARDLRQAAAQREIDRADG